MLIYEPLKWLNFQKNLMTFLIFQPRDTANLKRWSTSANDMRQKQQQERNEKSEILSSSVINFDITLVTSITL